MSATKFQVRLAPKARAQDAASRENSSNPNSAEKRRSTASTPASGFLSKVRIDNDKLDRLQVNMLRSHAVGIGAPLSEPETRASILLRANTLAAGHSGVTIALVEALLAHA